MAGIIGKKIGMSSFFSEEGKSIPCTIVHAGPCVVTQIKTIEKDGYQSVQLGYDDMRKNKASKSDLGRSKKAESSPKKVHREFSGFTFVDANGSSTDKQFKLGEEVTVDIFKEGEFVDVTSNSKGQGFQGVVKRYNFKGVGDATHGQHNRMRAPGSIGAASYPARVFKGMRMGGRMGGKQITVKNLKVLKVLSDKNVVVLKGAIPGSNNTYINITN
jgi:large subunit ribosomal protein L3